MAYVYWARGKGEVARWIMRGDIPWGDEVLELNQLGMVENPDDPVVVRPDGKHRQAWKALKDAGGKASRKQRGVFVGQGSKALFFINGALVGQLRPGGHRLDAVPDHLADKLSVFSPQVLLVDLGETWLDFDLGGFHSADNQDVRAWVQIALVIQDAEIFLATEGNLREELRERVVDTLTNYVRERDAADLDTPSAELRKDLLLKIEAEIGDILQRSGMSVVAVNAFRTHGKLEERQREAARWRRETLAELDRRLLDEEVRDRMYAVDRSIEEKQRKRLAAAKAEEEARQAEQQEANEFAAWLAKEKRLDDKDRQAILDARSRRQTLENRQSQIDFWARAASQTLDAEILEKSHIAELKDRLAKMSQDYRKKTKLLDEDWRRFERDVDWAELQDQWEDAEHQWQGKDRAEQLELKTEQNQRMRSQILDLLDMRLAQEVAWARMEKRHELQELALDLNGRLDAKKISQKTANQRLSELARQELDELLFTGKREAWSREAEAEVEDLDHEQAITTIRLEFEGQLKAMKAEMGKADLRVEAEMKALAADVLTAALDEQLARNLVAEAEKEGARSLAEIEESIKDLQSEANLERDDRAKQQQLRWADEDYQRKQRELNDNIELRRSEIELQHDAQMLEMNRELAELEAVTKLNAQIDDEKFRRDQEAKQNDLNWRLAEEKLANDYQLAQLKSQQDAALAMAREQKEVEITRINSDVEKERIRGDVEKTRAEHNAQHERNLRLLHESKDAEIREAMRETARVLQARGDELAALGDKRVADVMEAVKLGGKIAGGGHSGPAAPLPSANASNEELVGFLKMANAKQLELLANYVNKSAGATAAEHHTHIDATVSQQTFAGSCGDCGEEFVKLPRRCTKCGTRLT